MQKTGVIRSRQPDVARADAKATSRHRWTSPTFVTVFRVSPPEFRDANLALVDLILEIAARKAATPAQVVLGWLLARKPWIVPIPGTTKLHRLEENLGGAGIKFAADELDEITTAGTKLQLMGDRMPEGYLALTGK